MALTVAEKLINLGIAAELASFLSDLLGPKSVVGSFVGKTVGSHFFIGTDTLDTADTAALFLCGGGSASASRGASVNIRGNESSGGPGFLELLSGSVTNGVVYINALGSGGSIQLLTTSLERWRVNASGNLVQESTNGGNVVLTKASTAVAQPYATGITAAGTVIGDATALTSVTNVITTAAASTGVKLWDAPLGSEVFVYNGGANTVNVWPTGASDTINGGSGGAAITIATGKARIFKRLSATAWYSMLGA